MAEEPVWEDEYKGKKFSIKLVKNRPTLFVENRQVTTMYVQGADVYVTNLSYRRFGSLAEIARSIIDSKGKE